MIRTVQALSLWILVSCAFAQTPGKRPAFEVATVKVAPSEPSDPYQAGYRAGMGSRGIVIEGKRVTVTNNSLRDLVRLAWRVKDHQVAAPPWAAAQRFDVVASLPEAADGAVAPDMLRALLEERFHLECHEEPKEMAVLALVPGKGGFKPAKIEANNTWTVVTPGAGRGGMVPASAALPVRMKGATMAAFADRLTRFTDKPVVDMTEMPGTYDFSVTFATVDSDIAPSLFTALQEQMGLKLEPRKATVKTVVVDRADKVPVEN